MSARRNKDLSVPEPLSWLRMSWDRRRENDVAKTLRGCKRIILIKGNRQLALVIEIPARTAAGRRAKVEVARTRVQLSSAGEPQSDDDALLWSLCDDLAVIGSEA
jgi:hypothetical protein